MLPSPLGDTTHPQLGPSKFLVGTRLSYREAYSRRLLPSHNQKTNSTWDVIIWPWRLASSPHSCSKRTTDAPDLRRLVGNTAAHILGNIAYWKKTIFSSILCASYENRELRTELLLNYVFVCLQNKNLTFTETYNKANCLYMQHFFPRCGERVSAMHYSSSSMHFWKAHAMMTRETLFIKTKAENSFILQKKVTWAQLTTLQHCKLITPTVHIGNI